MLSLVHVLEWRAAVHPGAIALSDQQGAELTYAGLAAAVERSAAGFAAAGIAPGDVVPVIARNQGGWVTVVMTGGLIAICYAVRMHYNRVRKAIEQLEADILPEIFEHERFSTTVANAVLAPVVGSYAQRLESRMKAGGYDEDVLLLHSGGGVMTAKTAEKSEPLPPISADMAS